MGAFYGSILVRTEKSDEVQKAFDEVAKATDCKFLMGPVVNGWISGFPNNSGQNEKTSVEIAKRLPNDIFHLIVHDDDIFAYFFFRKGQLVDQYDSCPDYFKKVSLEEKQRWKGRPELFQDLLTKSGSLNKLKTLLAANKEKYSFEQERMREFVELLGLPNALGSYEYLDSGERDGIKGWKQFIHIPDLTAEKTAKKAAQNKIKAEKKRLQSEGLFLAEIKPVKEGEIWPDITAWGINKLGSAGFIVTPVEGKQTVTNINGISDGIYRLIVHPSGKWGVVKLQGWLGIVDIQKRQLIKKLAVNRRMETIDPFARDSDGVLAHTCLKDFLKNPQVREKLGVDAHSHAAIMQDPKAVEKLSTDVQQKIKTLLENVRQKMRVTMETQEGVFDVRFNPNGEQLFIATKGMRVFDWSKVLSAEKDTPAPEFSVDAPIADETDPNSRPLAYSVRFDTERNLLLSGCLAGVIQYLNVQNGQSGTLLKLLDEVSIRRLELTDDRNGLCCFCTSRPQPKNLNKREDFLQVWSYPALCKAAALD
jgi:predicted RNA-binding protein Jag